MAKSLEEDRFLEHHHFETDLAGKQESPKHTRSPRNSISVHDPDKLNLVRTVLEYINNEKTINCVVIQKYQQILKFKLQNCNICVCNIFS